MYIDAPYEKQADRKRFESADTCGKGRQSQVPYFLNRVGYVDNSGTTSVISPAPSISDEEHNDLFRGDSDKHTNDIRYQ